MIKAIIIDDERNSRDIISLMLARYCPQIEVVSMASNCKEGIEHIKIHRPQLVFLDLEMPDGTGFDVLNGAYDGSFEAVFVTAFEKRFLHAIRFSEIALMLKPIDKESLVQTVGQVEERLANKMESKRYDALLKNFDPHAPYPRYLISTQADGQENCIPVNKIDYIENNGEYAFIHLADAGTIRTTKSFRYYAELFSHMGFYQVNNTQLVQLSHVKKLDSSNFLHLKSGTKLEVTDRRRKDLISQLK
ncbi:hypothetical protein COR50_03605 [Chitinophaga caeni]|uniref:Response regulatory domain-containing protein n=1 Tax=Chitinophaga caeni TaxID=2029983 RepID=A0A291QR24_9BACT|nr:LytTR family DNA-binding domain-containing protein [Chitinophaga caeni]ATL46332.1 hypothetical protein COR50_03605 [Chitinophaga caeni]